METMRGSTQPTNDKAKAVKIKIDSKTISIFSWLPPVLQFHKRKKVYIMTHLQYNSFECKVQ